MKRSVIKWCFGVNLFICQVATVQYSSFAQDEIQAENKESDVKQSEVKESQEVIEVYGIRRSFRESQMLKRESKGVVDAISAEDLGKLPDQSIADSLSRLPGLATQRLDGRSNVITIRGIGPEFNGATLNGREVVSVNNGRAVEFDQYPAELINQVVVYKTPLPSAISHGIGGVVELGTISPLSLGQPMQSYTFKSQFSDGKPNNADATRFGYRLNGAYVDQFMDGKLGLALGIASLATPTEETQWHSWGYPTLTTGEYVLGGAKPFTKSNLLTRHALMTVIEYEASPKLKIDTDIYYSLFNDHQILRGVEIPGGWGIGGMIGDVEAIDVEDNFVTKGRIVDGKALVRNDMFDRDASLFSIGTKATHQLFPSTNLILDLSHSSVKRKDIALESYAGTGRGDGAGVLDTYEFTMNGDKGAKFKPNIDYADPSVVKLGGTFSWGDPMGNGAFDSQDGFINKPEVTDSISAVKLVAKHEASYFFNQLESGLRFATRRKTLKDHGTFLTLKSYLDDKAMLELPSKYKVDATDFSEFGFGKILSYNSQKLYDDGYYIENDEINTGRLMNDWSVTEKVTNFYLQGDFATELMDFDLSGLVGTQVVYTNQSSGGKTVTVVESKNIVDDIEKSYSYTEFLPSLILSAALDEKQIIRFGVSRTMTRALMDDLKASFVYGFNPSNNNVDAIKKGLFPWSRSGGNIELKPIISKNMELSYENYLSDLSYFSVATYFKNFENYVFTEQKVGDFSGLPSQGAVPITTLGKVTRPVNTKGGVLRGIEGTLSLDAGLLLPQLRGLGTIINSAYVYATLFDPEGNQIEMPGLSNRMDNLTVYYENYGFQARVNISKRSDFLGEIAGLSLARQKVFVKGTTITDLSLGYEVPKNSFLNFEKMNVGIQISNLTNEPWVSRQNKEDQYVIDYMVYGRTINLGVTATI